MRYFIGNTQIMFFYNVLLLAVLSFQCINYFGVMIMHYNVSGKRIRLVVESFLFVYLFLIAEMIFSATLKVSYSPQLERVIDIIQYSYCALFLGCNVWLLVCYRRMPAIPLILCDFAILPCIRHMLSDFYPYLILIVLVYLGVRCYVLGIHYNRRRVNGVTGLSIKQAIDNLPSGLLVYSLEGDIILMNRQMMDLVFNSMGKMPANGTKIYWFFVRRVAQKGDLAINLNGKVLYDEKTDQYWVLNYSNIEIKNKKYAIITASNVTKEWKLTKDLELQNMELQKQGEELKHAIQDMERQCKEEEIVRLKAVFHDVLGHRIALILRSLQERKDSEELLDNFAGNIQSNLFEMKNEDEYKQQLQVLKKTFNGIDVNLDIRGYLPKENDYAKIFVDIIRETATNAVRHGFAKKIWVQMRTREEEYLLKITNDGQAPSHNMTPGNGLRGIQKRLNYVGGQLIVDRTPQFAILASIPRLQAKAEGKECGYDKNINRG